MTNIPVEIVLRKPLHEEQIIDASFQFYFQIGTQKYVAVKREGTTFLLKVFYKEGREILMDIPTQEEFDSAHEVFQKIHKTTP